MSLVRRRRAFDIWPAFVDATASLLMVVIFVLLIAVVGQQFLTEAILGRDQALARLNAQVSDLADMLAMQERRSAGLAEELAVRSASLDSAEATLATQADELAEQATILDQRAAIIDEQAAALNEKQAHAEQLEQDIAALEALRQRIEHELETTLAERDDISQRLAAESTLNLAAQAQVERLNGQLAELRKQLAALAHALEVSEADIELKQQRIDDLGQRLNLALASKASQLQRYRSEFFGRLREVLSDVPGVHIVGDRFVLPSGLLFDSASDTLGGDGRGQIARLAATLNEVVRRIPGDLDWVLRIDGHTDRRPIHTARFPSNWELSAARAISIARELVRRGVPANRIAATGFADYHPVDDGDDDAALARNRRIEIKLTSR